MFRFTGVNWDSDQHQHPDDRFMTMVAEQIRPVGGLGEYFNTDQSSLNPLGYGFYTYGMLPLFITRYVAEWFARTTYDEVVLVGRVSGGAPYRLYGHESPIFNVAFSPDGSMIASSDKDGVVRIRPVPDLSKPPLGGLPLAELLAKLDTHTNVRMVRDEQSGTGWTEEVGPFQGWAEVPEW